VQVPVAQAGALADALGVPRRALSLVGGATSRTKIVDVEGVDGDTLARLLADLRGRGGPQGAG
jgi:uncharacterized protein YggU (UPF0235/DUF167 family)